MSAKEYYDSAPGQEIQSLDSFWQGNQPPPPTNTHSPPLHIPPPKNTQQDYFTFQGVPTLYTNATSPSKPIPVPPPQAIPVPPPQAIPVPPPPQALPVPPSSQQAPRHHFPSPPLGSPVTDESDDSLNRVPSHLTSQLRPGSRPDNLITNHAHNGLDHASQTSSLSYGPGPRRQRRREKELTPHNKQTLIQLLVRQEYEAEESRRLLHLAVSKLQISAQRLAEADIQRQALEVERKRMLDERLTLNVKVTEAVMQAQQQAATAQQELALVKLKLKHAEDEVDRAKSVVRAVEEERDEAERAAARARDSARRMREDTAVREAREQGRREGFDDGMKQGRVLGITQGGGTIPRRITQAGEPNSTRAPPTVNTTNPPPPPVNETSIEGDGAAFIEVVNESAAAEGQDPNTSHSTEGGHSRARSTPRTERPSLESNGKGKRVSRAEFEDAVQRFREEERTRLQREMELALNQERDRLKMQVLQQEQRMERELQREREAAKERDRQRERERHQENQRLRELELEKERERELREKEQLERERERKLRDRERELELRDRAQERELLRREREQDKQRARERDRERDMDLAAAAAAAVSATRSTSDSGSASDTASRPRVVVPPVPPLPYLPMPAPPNMPTPSVTMPEPSIPLSRPSTTQPPNLPSTVPARTSRRRRTSLDSQSSASTMTGLSHFDILTFPPVSRTDSAGSTRTRTVVGAGPSSRAPSGIRNGIYTRPHLSENVTSKRRDGLSDIPEDASLRALSLSPEVPGGRGPGMPVPPVPPSSQQQQQQQPPGWLTNPPLDMSKTTGPPPPPVPTIPVPNIQVDVEGWRTGESSGHQNRDGERGQRYVPAPPMPMNMDYLNPQYQPRDSSLYRSESFNSSRPSIRSNSSYEFVVEPPSHPSSPLSGGQEQTPQNNYLSPRHATIPIPPVQTQPVVPRIPGATGGSAPTEPSSPSGGGVTAGALPPGFVPHGFTPNSAPAPALPPTDGGNGLPPGFMPQVITDTVTGVRTPITGMSSLPNVGSAPVIPGGTSGSNSRRQSLYGNPKAGEESQDVPNWGSAFGARSSTSGGGGGGGGGIFSPYRSASPSLSGPPVVPNTTFDDDAGGAGFGRTPSQRPRSIYGATTPGGSSRNLPAMGGTPSGGGVYQNPLRQEEGDGDGEDGVGEGLVERNTRINATAPVPAAAAKITKKKKKGR